MENGHVAGFVGLMELTARSVDRVAESVGGIWGVATLPSNARRGVSTLLLNEAHRHFRDRHYRFSFLTTRRTFIAYHLYLKLGYEDVTEFPSAFKIIHRKKPPSTSKTKDKKPDWERILDIYRRYTSDKTGLVVRDLSYMKMLQMRARTDFKYEMKAIVGENSYALYGMPGKSLVIHELVPDSEDKSDKLIREIEDQAQELIIDRVVLDKKLLGSYRLQGYMTQDRSHGLLMAKPLTRDATFRETYSDRFHLTSLDLF
jgi:predicted acetyltransferase